MQTQVLTIFEVAEMFKVTPKTVRRWWYSNEIPAPLKIGRSIRWRHSDIAAVIAPPVEIEKELT